VVKLLDGSFDTIATGDVVSRAREIDRELGGEYFREEILKDYGVTYRWKGKE